MRRELPSKLFKNRSNGMTETIPRTKVLFASSQAPISKLDSTLVTLSSLFFVGSVVWVPTFQLWLYKKWKHTSDRRKKSLYGTLLVSLVILGITGPHRSPRVGRYLDFRKWKLWRAWTNYFAIEMVTNSVVPIDKKEQAILAVSPHGIFPFSLAFALLPQKIVDIVGEYRPVVATATNLFPFVKTILSWMHSVDATRSSVDRSLSNGDRIGIAPGGILEMFENYPKKGRKPNEECVLLESRKGFIRMAIKHGVPVIPVFCFGGSKAFKRLQFPPFVEKISNTLRISLCILFGRWGLPVPFFTKLLYAIGSPIYPPRLNDSECLNDTQVNVMHERYCNELRKLFETYKEDYGWSNKQIRFV